MIQLTVPCLASSMAVLRTTAGAVAARAPLTIDQVEDVRMGVEEAAMLLLPSDQRITVTMDPVAVPFVVTVAVGQVLEMDVNPDSLPWTVLRGVTDQLDLRHTSSGTELVLQFNPITADL